MRSYQGQLGSTVAGSGNLVSSNGLGGLWIASGSAAIQGNTIGTTADGETALPNNGPGIAIAGYTNLIGGTSSGARNIISGNKGPGIVLFYTTGLGPQGPYPVPPYDYTIQGNFIWTDATGTRALPNTGDGIDASSGSVGTIGGIYRGFGNLVSGNGGDGIKIGSSYNRLRGSG